MLFHHHHYPTTVTLSVERRMKLLELSKRFSFVIIEDDYDYDYHYSSVPFAFSKYANHNGNVIYMVLFKDIRPVNANWFYGCSKKILLNNVLLSEK